MHHKIGADTINSRSHRVITGLLQGSYILTGVMLLAGLIHAVNDTNEQMILSFDSLLPRTQATVSIAFDYSLRPGLEGLYRSQFTGTSSLLHTLPNIGCALLSCERVLLASIVCMSKALALRLQLLMA